MRRPEISANLFSFVIDPNSPFHPMKDFGFAIPGMKTWIRFEDQLLELFASLGKIEDERIGQHPKQLLTAGRILIFVLG